MKSLILYKKRKAKGMGKEKLKILFLQLIILSLLMGSSMQAASDDNFSSQEGSSQDLIDAVINRELTQVEELLKNKEINLEARNADGHTALHIAIGHSETNSELDPFVKALIEAGADVMAKGGSSQGTPLHYAAFHYMSNGSGRMTIKTLLENEEVDVNATDKHGQTVLHFVVFPEWLGEMAIVLGGHADLMNLLLTNKDIKINEMDNNGQTPLDLIIKWDDDQREVKDGMYVLRENEKRYLPYQMKFQKAIALLRSKGGGAMNLSCQKVY